MPDDSLDRRPTATIAPSAAADPRDGDETEVIERDGGAERRPTRALGPDPRPGDPTVPLEEGDRPWARTRSGDVTEAIPFG